MRDWPTEDVERAREILVRAVAQTCPGWLRSRRDDIVQDALLRVLNAGGGKGSDLPGPSYLWKVAYSATIDEIRRQKRHRAEEPLETASGMNPQLSQAVTRAPREDPELRRALRQELAQLKTSRRLAVLLQLYGFSLAESARILGWPAKRVENHRYLGLSDLRRRLKEEGFER